MPKWARFATCHGFPSAPSRRVLLGPALHPWCSLVFDNTHVRARRCFAPRAPVHSPAAEHRRRVDSPCGCTPCPWLCGDPASVLCRHAFAWLWRSDALGPQWRARIHRVKIKTRAKHQLMFSGRVLTAKRFMGQAAATLSAHHTPEHLVGHAPAHTGTLLTW